MVRRTHLTGTDLTHQVTHLGAVADQTEPAPYGLQKLEILHAEVLGPGGTGLQHAAVALANVQGRADLGADAQVLPQAAQFPGVLMSLIGVVGAVRGEHPHGAAAVGQGQPMQAQFVLPLAHRRAASAQRDQAITGWLIEEGIHLLSP